MQYADQQDEQGRAIVVGNGYQPERAIQTGFGPVSVQIPKARSRQGTPITFHSALVPPYVRKTATPEAAIPWLYLKGISTGEMQTALEALVGPEAQGLSASTVARLKQAWREEESHTWRQHRLHEEDWVYIWVDGIYRGLTGRSTPTLCTRGHWDHEQRRETALSHRRWGARIDPELAGSAAVFESPRPERAGLAYWGRCPVILGRIGRNLSHTPGSNGVGCTRPAMCSMLCPRVSSLKRNRRCMRFGKPKPKMQPPEPSTYF